MIVIKVGIFSVRVVRLLSYKLRYWNFFIRILSILFSIIVILKLIVMCFSVIFKWWGNLLDFECCYRLLIIFSGDGSSVGLMRFIIDC